MSHSVCDRAEIDSNADTCCFGNGAYIVNDTGHSVSVDGFINSLGSLQGIPIVTAAVAYDDPSTFQTCIPLYPESLYMENLTRHLLCPNQMRANQVIVHDIPLIYTQPEDRNKHQHSIITSDPELHIPLKLDGTTSYFDTRKPTDEEVKGNANCIHIYMTSDAPWEPHDKSNHRSEEAIRATLDQHYTPPDRTIRRIHSTRTSAAIDIDSYADALYCNISSTKTTSNRKGLVSAEQLSKRWHIGLESAQRTIDRTTQLAVRDFTSTTGTRRLKPYAMQLKYPRLNVEMYVDILIGRTTSLMGNKYAAVYCTPFHWMTVDPIKKRSDVHQTLDTLFRRVGIPKVLIPDNAQELTQGEFRRKALKAQAAIHPIEAHTPNQNIAESGIRELKRMYRRLMSATNTPECLWDLCLVYAATIRSHTALNIRELDGEVPQTMLTGDTSDISMLCEFGWYEYVWYLSPADDNMEIKHLGRYCGPSRDVGEALCARILTRKGKFVHRSSVLPLSDEEQRSPVVAKKIEAFEAELKEALGQKYDPLKPDQVDKSELTPEFEPYEPIEPDDPKNIPLVEDDEVDHDAFNQYISARVCLPQGDQMAYGTVKRRRKDEHGNFIGHSNKNPLLDTSFYDVEFDSGETEAYSANIIAENIYSQVDQDGYTHLKIKEIIDHRSDHTAAKGDHYYTTKRGLKLPKRTTKGWQLCVQMSDGSTSWESLRELKETDPLMVAEYAVNNKIDHEPAFVWWVPYTIRKRDRVIKAMKKRYWRRHQKYGIEIPKTIKRAREIDDETGTTFWTDAINKEMKNVAKAFEILPEGVGKPPGYTNITVHMVFDVKADFTRKARLVAGGHMTDPPSSVTYASVVSRESVRLAFLIAALNGLDIQAADIGNAYLNAPPREKITLENTVVAQPRWLGLCVVLRVVELPGGLTCLKSYLIHWDSSLAELTMMSTIALLRSQMDPSIMSIFLSTLMTYWQYLLTQKIFFATLISISY